MGSKPNVSLQWLYADSEENAGRDGVPLDDGSKLGFNYTVTVLTTTSSDNSFRLAMLELGKKFALGYYWCKVKGAMDSQFQNPSQVMRISTACYPNSMCSSNALSTLQGDLSRCANGNYQQDVVIVDMQNTSGCVVAPTDARVPTEGDGKEDVTGDGGGVVTEDGEKAEHSQTGKGMELETSTFLHSNACWKAHRVERKM